MTEQFTLSFILAIAGAVSAGLVGAFALMRRMTLAGDVLSHVALPGLGLAILFFPAINPLWGGATTLLLGTLLVWHLQKRTNLSSETAIGVIFASSLAIAALLTTNEELIDALFGGDQAISFMSFAFGLGIALLISIFIVTFRHKLTLALFSPDLAQSAGLNVDRLNLYYLLSFSATILIGLRLLGALLVGALIIIPAAAARQLTHNLRTFLVLSVAASVFSVVTGIFISTHYGLEQGPVVVVIASLLFGFSLLKKHP